jgi:sialate O-acetylesterase
MKKRDLFLLVIIVSSISINAQVSMPKFFANNMVLQRNTPIPIWGWAKANEKVEIKFDKQTKIAKADKNGKWIVKLNPETAGGPFILKVKAGNTIQINNVLVGEVWICSGQSNMEYALRYTIDAKKEIASANNPFIRHIKIPRAISSLPEDDISEGKWNSCDSTTVGDFSAAAYYFAKEIYNKLKIPVGIISSNWGGTNIETWISREAFENTGVSSGSEQANEFNEMIAMMPKVSLDSISKLKVSSSTRRIEALQGSKINNINPDSFKEIAFDDSKWPELNQPEVWEQQRLGEFDGVVWLRKTIVLSAEDSKKEAILELSKVDDEDITYVNGVKVGSMNTWDSKREYTISAGILKEGKNVIAVRVTDNGGGGGIYGDTADLKLMLGSISSPLGGKWKFQVESIKKGTNENSLPSLCYNAMINPLIPFAFQGVLWYQGESNAIRAYQYRKAFPLLINDWRQKWNMGSFPFYFVQLATYKTTGNSNEGCGWAELREAQTLTLNLPNTGMAVTTDIGNPEDIHPGNKLDVGKRLAALALNNVYNRPMVCNGPKYKSMEIDRNQIVVSFDDIGSGLLTPDKYGYIKGFEMAGKDQVFHYAKAYIKDNKVLISSAEVQNPTAVHFGWIGDASDNNLFNIEGFPAVPFRTDEWKTITKEEKYTIAN